MGDDLCLGLGNAACVSLLHMECTKVRSIIQLMALPLAAPCPREHCFTEKCFGLKSNHNYLFLLGVSSEWASLSLTK